MSRLLLLVTMAGLASATAGDSECNSACTPKGFAVGGMQAQDMTGYYDLRFKGQGFVDFKCVAENSPKDTSMPWCCCLKRIKVFGIEPGEVNGVRTGEENKVRKPTSAMMKLVETMNEQKPVQRAAVVESTWNNVFVLGTFGFVLAVVLFASRSVPRSRDDAASLRGGEKTESHAYGAV